MDVAVLGPVELTNGTGTAVPVAGARLRTLLILLALDAGRAVSTGRLVDGVWGAEPPGSAAGALQALISRLRRAAPALAIAVTPNGYRLDLAPDRVDAHRFARLVAQGRPEEALALWRGPTEFPDVARPEAVRLEELRLTALLDRAEARLRAGGDADLVGELEALATAHPAHEPLAGLLIRALVGTGHPGRALTVFERIRAELADTLGADPSAELTALHLELLRGQHRPARGNLPAAVSSFVGREHDLRVVRELVGAHRLVTLTGPGGSGKTRLSVEAGQALADGCPDGVWRVELAPVTDPAEVPQAVLTALKLRSQLVLTRPGGGPVGESVPPLQRLTDALAGKELLLILDNCEHLIGAAAEVADAVLRGTPGLRLLATSREPLGIAGEQLWPVEPLALPPTEAEAASFPAVRLLLDRAVAARPGFTLDRHTVGPVVRICRALDGMPLAIELAAARLRTLPVDVLADRLADRFRLLTTGSRTALPRHQTLRAVVDWSWELLDAGERALWRRFAVFHGGAGVTAVEQVCGTDVDLLGALVDKSLLVLDGDRYRMLETIREYGLERLAAAGETEQLRVAHARYLLALADAAEPQLRRQGQLTWLHRLGAEHDNLHAAVRAAIEAGDARTATALTARLGWYWWLRGHRAEGCALARDVLRLDGPADREDRALTYTYTALNGLEGAAPMEEVKGWFLAAEREGAGPDADHPVLRLLRPLSLILQAEDQVGGPALIEPLFADPDPWLRAVAKMIVAQLRLNFGNNPEQARTELREALDGFRATGERWGMGFALSTLGDMAAASGRFTDAVSWQRESLALVREVGIREDVPQLQAKLAQHLWRAGERDEARRMLKEAREAAEEVGLSQVTAAVEYGYAVLAREEGELDEARARIARATELIGTSTFAQQVHALTHSMLALIEAGAGDLAAAHDLHVTAVRLAAASQDAPVLAQVLVGVADQALRTGDPERAAMLLGAADAVRGTPDRSMPDTDRVTGLARAALGDAGFQEAYRSGGSVTMATAPAATGLQETP
ncbi:BTAD domain-containing putative transcriptional regulator [Actinoplanes sp. NPDC049599]|uniref:BTAD domain-containing putative transcriptional regulator n=1 Tax=Actinoplanes sp. NPDC049599 TaxID=3363903 RepID=UPI003790C2C9